MTTSPAPARTSSATRTMPLLGIGELAFALVTAVTVLSMRRVFAGDDWLAPLLVHAAAAHATASVLRRRGVSTTASVLVGTAVGVVVLGAVHAGSTTLLGVVPTPETAGALVEAVGDAFGRFDDVRAPTEALDGFVVATAVAVWAGTLIGDWAAFRSDAAVEGVLPAASLFAVGSVLGADVDRVALTGAWVAAVLAFVLVRRADRLARRGGWVGDHRHRGPRSLVVVGVGLVLVATTVAAVVGPRLPGAEAEAVVSLTDLGEDDPGSRVTVSPLVDIRSRLVQQADVEVFTVRSAVRSYWRLTSLETFDGAIWKSNGSYGKASGDLDDGVSVDAERIVFDQRYQIGALAQIWLPAAYEPRSIEASVPVRYDEVSGTLIVDTDVPSSDGSAYTVRSALPQHQPDELASTAGRVPEDIADTYLQLPAGFSTRVRSLASELTRGAANPYEAALSLQAHLRNGFRYDIAVDLAHSIPDLEAFLFDVRAGYCEQFAGAFAAMARSIGLPARVAVGFTTGVPDPAEPDLFRVRGEHAHAWPEVYLGDSGWVAFEPTPGRGAPFAEQYTGIPEQQAASGTGGSTGTTLAPALVPEPATPPPPAPGMSPPTFPDDVPDDAVAGPGDDGGPNPWPLRIAVGAAVLSAAALAYLLAVLTVTGLARWRRRRRATTPVARVALAWEESVGAARRAGVPVRGSHTQAQAAAEIGRRIPAVDQPIRALASTVEATAFSPTPPDEETAARALTLADQVGAGTRAEMGPAARFRTRFDPRLLRRR